MRESDMAPLSPTMVRALRLAEKGHWWLDSEGDPGRKTAKALAARGLVFAVGFDEFSRLGPSVKMCLKRAGKLGLRRTTCGCADPVLDDGSCQRCGAPSLPFVVP